MAFPVDDVITAVASAAGHAPQGIVRLSGPDTQAVLTRCFPEAELSLQETRYARLIRAGLVLAPSIAPLPCHIYYWPDQRSYTRQPSAEIYLAGSPPLLEATVERLCQHGARLAEPGEFTMRAFLAGRLDLTQVEAVLGVIDAANQQELDVALTQLAGGLATPLHQLRQELLALLAHLEAGLDFVEEDIQFITPESLEQQLTGIEQAMQSILHQIEGRQVQDTQARIVLRGAANVGKSSLLNALTGNPTAIVSNQQCTTRDYLTQRCYIRDLACMLVDTAGITEQQADNNVDRQAQALSDEQASQATVELFCLDGSRNLNPWEQSQLTAPAQANRILVATKDDLSPAMHLPQDAIRTSSLNGTGLETLKDAIHEQLTHGSTQSSPVIHDTLLRCRESLRTSHDCIQRARVLTQDLQGEELVAAELRVALDALGTVVGAVYTDDLLDQIFSKFCIGK